MIDFFKRVIADRLAQELVTPAVDPEQANSAEYLGGPHNAETRLAHVLWLLEEGRDLEFVAGYLWTVGLITFGQYVRVRHPMLVLDVPAPSGRMKIDFERCISFEEEHGFVPAGIGSRRVEDAIDRKLIEERRDEPTVPWEEVKARLGLDVPAPPARAIEKVEFEIERTSSHSVTAHPKTPLHLRSGDTLTIMHNPTAGTATGEIVRAPLPWEIEQGDEIV